MRYDLDDAAASIRRIAERHGGELRAELREPATDAELRACEEVVGHPLAPSQREFLKVHNGAMLRVFNRRHRLDQRPFAIPTYKLDLFGTDEIVQNVRDLEETFRGEFSEASRSHS